MTISERIEAVRSAIFMHAVFGKAGTLAVFMTWFLPAPQIGKLQLSTRHQLTRWAAERRLA